MEHVNLRSKSSSSGSKKRHSFVPDTNFNVNWEVQAEQLKYTIKKEIDEAHLIEEALKSLQRSFKNEEEKRKRAEEQKMILVKQIEALENSAKQLKEKIRVSRVSRNAPADEIESDSDSDSEPDTEGDDFDEVPDEDEDEFEHLMSELRDDEDYSYPTEQMSVGQRLKLIQGFSTANPEQTHKAKKQKYLERHKVLMKEWIKRDSALHRGFDEVSRFTIDAGHSQARKKYLSEFIVSEKDTIQTINSIVKDNLEKFLRSKILALEHLNICFANIAAFLPLQTQLIQAAEAILHEKGDFCAIGQFLNYNVESYSQFIQARKDGRDLLSMASKKARFVEFTTQTKIDVNRLNAMMDSIINRIRLYPEWIVQVLPHVNEFEYSNLSIALARLTNALSESIDYTPPVIPNRAEIFAIQNNFDWLNKDGHFLTGDRELLAKADIKRRKKDKSLEDVHFYLFSDVLVITRNMGTKQIFQSFVPLNQLLVWDVPPRANCDEAVFEVVNIKTSKKQELACETEEDQSKLIETITVATLSQL